MSHSEHSEWGCWPKSRHLGHAGHLAGPPATRTVTFAFTDTVMAASARGAVAVSVACDDHASSYVDGAR